MEHNEDEIRRRALYPGGNHHPGNRGRGRGRGRRGRGGFIYIPNLNNNTNELPPRNNNIRDSQHNGQRDASNQNGRRQGDRPWTPYELRAWLKKAIEFDPDQILSNLTGRDKNKFKNALDDRILFDEIDIVELMVKLLASPDLIDHIQATACASVYAVVMASRFLLQLNSFMSMHAELLSKKCVRSLVKLLGHLLDMSRDSISDLVPLIERLEKLEEVEEGLAKEIKQLAEKRDHMKAQHQKQRAQAKDDGGPRGNFALICDESCVLNSFFKGNFRDIPLFPSKEEMFSSPTAKHLRKNKVAGEHYLDVDDYLDVQYRLLHEDGFADVRKAVYNIHRGNVGNNRLKGVKIYWHVPVVGTRLDQSGIFFQMHIGANSKINWARSKRLMTGALLCISSDDFASDLLWAVVRRRDNKQLARVSTLVIDLNIKSYSSRVGTNRDRVSEWL